ncbi:MAG: MFS transporter, partial [Bacteroidota bacterium]
PFWIIFFLSLSFLGNGLASITWVFVSLIAPRQIIGLIGGVFNFMGGLSAVLVPIAIGYFAKEGDFRPALLFIGILGMVGFMAYVFLVGKVERIELTSPT